MFDRFYTEVDNEAEKSEDNTAEVEDDTQQSTLQYYTDKSSSYYLEKQIKLKEDLSKF